MKADVLLQPSTRLLAMSVTKTRLGLTLLSIATSPYPETDPTPRLIETDRLTPRPSTKFLTLLTRFICPSTASAVASPGEPGCSIGRLITWEWAGRMPILRTKDDNMVITQSKRGFMRRDLPRLVRRSVL